MFSYHWPCQRPCYDNITSSFYEKVLHNRFVAVASGKMSPVRKMPQKMPPLKCPPGKIPIPLKKLFY